MENEQLQIARFENMEINCIQTNTMDAMDSLTIVEKKDLLHTINNSPLKMQHVVKKYMIMIFVIVALGVPLTVCVCWGMSMYVYLSVLVISICTVVILHVSTIIQMRDFALLSRPTRFTI